MTTPTASDVVPGWTAKTPAGHYRRRIRVAAQGRSARTEMEDDPHRFSVSIEHDGEVVAAVTSHGERFPWSVCAEAGAKLELAIGAAIDVDVTALGRWTRANDNCTHRFDAAALAIAQAARGDGTRQYDMAVGPLPGGRRDLVLQRNGETVLHWAIDGTAISADGLGDGQDVRHILKWAQSTLDPDAVEAIFVARRGVLVSTGRGHDPLHITSPERVMFAMAGACYVFQPENAPRAVSLRHTYRDFEHHADRLLSDVDGFPTG